jgi:hypothetical protein
LLTTLQAPLDRVPGDHRVDAEVFPDVAQKGRERQRLEPVGVVDHQCLRVSGGEVDDLFHLLADRLDVRLQHFFGHEHPLGLPAARVADQAGAPAHHRDRLVPAELEPPEVEELDQSSEMKAFGGGIEAAVSHEPLLRQHLGQVGIGDLMDQAAPLQL